MAMWSFYYRYTKQKADRWQNMCFRQSNVSCCTITIKCVWLQYFLIFLSCVDCSRSPTKSSISDSMSSVESVHEKSYFQFLKKISQIPEMQNSVTQIPFWEPKVLKTGLKPLNAIPVLKPQTILESSHKRNKRRRQIKREIKNNGSSPDLTSTFTETLRILGAKTLYQLPELENIESVTRSSSGYSDMQTPTSDMNNFLDAETSTPVQGNMRSTLKHTTFAKPGDVSATGSLNRGHAAVTDLKLFLVQSENPFPSTQGFQLSNGNHIGKLRHSTDRPESLFPVTDETKVLAENGSNVSTMNSSDFTNNGLDELSDSDLKTAQSLNAIPKPATDRFNLLDSSVPPKHNTSTFSNMVTPNLKSAAISLKHSDAPVTKTTLTNINSSSSMTPGNAKLYSQKSKPSLSALFFDFLDSHTSVFLTDDFASVTPQTKRNVEIKTTLNTEDISHMTTQQMGSSPIKGTLGIFFTANFPEHVKEDTSTTETIVYTSKTDQTSERDKSLDQQRHTLFASTWPSPKTMSTERMSPSFNWKTTLHLNLFSSVTPSTFQEKDKACVLQIHDPMNTQLPKLSETLSLSTVYKSPVYESDTTVLSSENSVTQVDGSSLPTVYKSPIYENDTTMLSISNSVATVNESSLPTVYKSSIYGSDTTVLSASNSVTPVDGSTLLEGTATEESSQFGTQSSVTQFQNNVFNDALNGNGKINETTLNLTSTLSSTISPVSSSLWKTRTSQEFNFTVQFVQNNQTSQSTLYSTGESKRSSSTLTAALQRTVLPKSWADPMVSTITALTSSTSAKNVVNKTHSTSQPRAVTASYTNIYPKRNVTALLFSTSKAQTVSSISSRLTSPSKTTLANATSAIKDAPAPKEWIPERVITIKPTTARPINYNSGQKVSVIPATITSVVSMPLNFQLAGVSFSEQLTNRTSEEYRKLEREVKLVMDKIFFNKYQDDYLDTEIKAFVKGSVIVRSNVVFQSVPSGSDIIRTVLTDGTNTNYFGWSINGSTVELNGYTQSNLAVETLQISFLVLRAGHIAVSRKNQEKQSFLDSLQKAVFQAVNKSFPISNVSISQMRDVHGDLAIRGNLYLNSTIHTNVQSLISSLLPLVNRSVDLGSIIVNGIRNELQIHSIIFRVTNKQFVLNLLDMSSSDSQLLSKDLAAVIESVLHASNPLQAIMREFRSGSLVCRGDILYLLPAPGSQEVLKLLLKNLGSDGSLGTSTYKVDFKSIIVGDSSPGPAYEYIDFPGFGVAIIVMCGLCILILPIIIFMCTKTRILGRRQKATIQRRPDLDVHNHHFEMDNRAFRASIEQP